MAAKIADLSPLRALAACSFAAALIAAEPAAQVRFDRDIRPLLSDRCFTCHGPDDAARKAGLRLDQRVSATAPRDGGPAIAPGDPSRSQLLTRLRHPDPAARMPPVTSGLMVSPTEVARLEEWIAAGAPYDTHWSFRPLRRPAIPDPADPATEALAPIDRFIRAQLCERGLQPAPSADRATLLRRVSFDLTGLPPTLAELDALLADPRPDAYERAVDALLARDSYGERMASDWLDVARYADTYGYQNDRERRVWPWRDWVVTAFNDNLPYDQFLTWQLAGDLLESPTRQQHLATAFNRLHRQTNEGGSVAEEMRLEYVADRAQTAATAFMGLTFECARCHDHKFDPISQGDFYRFTAFFDNIDEFGLYSHFTAAVPTPTLPLASPDVEAQITAARRAITTAETQLRKLRASRQPAFGRWRRDARTDLRPVGLRGHYPLDDVADGKTANAVPETQPAEVAPAVRAVPGRFGNALTLTGDDPVRLRGAGEFRRCDPFTVALWVRTPDAKERAVILHRSKAWTDAGSQGYELLIERACLQFSLIHFWPGNAASIRTRAPLPIGRWVHVAISHDGSARADGLTIHVDGAEAATETVRDGLTKSITGGGDLILTLGARFRDRGFRGGSVDEIQIYDRRLSDVEILWAAGAVASVAPTFEFYLTAIDPRWRAGMERLATHRAQLAQLLDGVPEIMVMRELDEPRPTLVRSRGRYDAPGDRVEPGTPDCLPPLPNAARDRLAVARWLTDPAHPLTARVAVNRLWQIVFGRGLVATSGDFGSQGSPPSHPALLDWLAVELVESGWDVKQLLKTLVTSATYRQSSARHGPAAAFDPENVWLARGPSGRLTAEMLRDQALAVSGLLVDTVGGPPVHPYQPPGLWQEKSGVRYQPATGDGLYRRSLYTVWKRTSPPPSMMIFDAAKRDVCVPRRQRTNTPLQALVLLDDPQYVEAARALAARVVRGGRGRAATEWLATLFRTLTSHAPDTAERTTLGNLFEAARSTFALDPDRAAALLGVGESVHDAALDPIDVAALTVVASTLMSHDAAVTKR
ncbi:MAG: DUF1553 domain-containing protein [Planctomycetota bacterium]